MTLPPSEDKAPRDRYITVMGFAVCAVAIGYAINLNDGMYTPMAIDVLTLGIAMAIVGTLWPDTPAAEDFAKRFLRMFLPVGIALETALLLYRERMPDSVIQPGIIFLGVLGLMLAIDFRAARTPLVIVMVLLFFLLLIRKIHFGISGIDVLMFQTYGSQGILRGRNPYAMRFPNVYYDPNRPYTPFYGPGVVDASGKWLRYGFPYPPLSLFIALAGWVLGDVRYAHAVGAAVTAFLIYATRPSRLSSLASALFILTPTALFVVFRSWTEPLLALNFSLAMVCAVRWPKLLPYALGLFFATKQYTVLCAPALFLLVERENQWRDLWRILWRAGIVAVAVTFPLFYLNPHAFIRAVVQWQMVQPFRPDALSYLVAIYQLNDFTIPPIWVPFAAIIPMAALALRKLPRTPAGFAGAVTLINLAFFAFNKQAFCNYYYFVVITACWAMGTAFAEPQVPGDERRDFQ